MDDERKKVYINKNIWDAKIVTFNNNNCGNKNNGSVIEDKSWRRSKHLEVFPNYSISKEKNK